MNESAYEHLLRIEKRNEAPPTAAPTPLHVWTRIALHVSCSAMLFPLVVTITGVAANTELGKQVANEGLGSIIFVLVMTSIYAAVVCGMTCLWFFALLALLERACRVRLPWPLLGALAGGFMAGGSLAYAMSPIHIDWNLFILGPLPAIAIGTTMGSYGGAIGGWLSQWRLEFNWQDRALYPQQICRNHDRTSAIRFQMSDLLAISALLCVGLGVAKLVGVLTPVVLSALGVWGAIETPVLIVGVAIWPNYSRWRIQRWEANQAT